jgi:hypothetical protein
MVRREVGHTQMSGGIRAITQGPCVKCQNARCFDKVILTKHLVQNGFTSNYETGSSTVRNTLQLQQKSLRKTKQVPIG